MDNTVVPFRKDPHPASASDDPPSIPPLLSPLHLLDPSRSSLYGSQFVTSIDLRTDQPPLLADLPPELPSDDNIQVIVPPPPVDLELYELYVPPSPPAALAVATQPFENDLVTTVATRERGTTRWYISYELSSEINTLLRQFCHTNIQKQIWAFPHHAVSILQTGPRSLALTREQVSLFLLLLYEGLFLIFSRSLPAVSRTSMPSLLRPGVLWRPVRSVATRLLAGLSKTPYDCLGSLVVLAPTASGRIMPPTVRW